LQEVSLFSVVGEWPVLQKSFDKLKC
jgi:hypothetical protein